MNRMRSLSTLEKPPFILAVFIGAVAWTVTRYADQLQSAPIIEYTVKTSEIKKQPCIDVHLENLTYNNQFMDLVFVLHGGGVSDPKIFPSAPAWEGPNAPSAHGDLAEFPISAFQPGWQFRLSASYTGPKIPEFQLKDATSPVRLVKPSVETFIIRHQNMILWVLLALWGSFTVIVYATRGEDDGESLGKEEGDFDTFWPLSLYYFDHTPVNPSDLGERGESEGGRSG